MVRIVHLALLIGALTGCGHGQLGATNARHLTPTHNRYVEELVARARSAKLWKNPQWLRLLHYRHGLLGPGFQGAGYTSEADGPNFFLAPRGKVEPQHELEATVRGLFSPMPATGPDSHPLCRFPARFIFLQRTLQIDAGRLPVRSCPAAEGFLRELDPGSLTLVFSSYYLNNPASAFGHTFLRVNRRHTLAVGEKRELLDYGIDYSADVDTGNALIYAIKGLTGMFPGTFKRIPYYYKVRAYNDYESRDLWEYELSLTNFQLALLSAHLWELGQTYFAYFYLSENCSYHILSLLEVANPSLQLLRQLSSPVIPADTVKALQSAPGLVRRISYRPSLRRQFEARVRELDEQQRSLVEELAHDADYPMPPNLGEAQAIDTLDAAADLVDVLHARELVHKEDNEAARRKQRLLERRAEILKPSAPLTLQPPVDERPELGHGSRRLGFGVAVADRQLAGNLEFRLALHDLADATPGYPELNAIEFMRVRLQLWSSRRIELDDLSLVRVTALTPQSRFDHKISWEFDVGATTVSDGACAHCLLTHVSGGAGAAFAFFDHALTIYALGHGTFGYAPGARGLADTRLRLGVGPVGGARFRVTPDLILLGSARLHWLPGQTPLRTYRIDGTLRWRAWVAFAFGLEGRLTPDGPEGQLLGFSYF